MLISVIMDGMISFSETESAVVLKEKDGKRQCLLVFHPVLLGKVQNAYQAPRDVPEDHVLAMNIIAEMGGVIHHLVIPRRRGSGYEMILHIQQGTRDIAQVMKASDALAFAACSQCPILMEEALLNEGDTTAKKVLDNILRATNQATLAEAEVNAFYLPGDKLPNA